MTETELLASALVVAAAVGLDVYLTLLLLAVAPLGGWLPPGDLVGLAVPAVVAVASGLYVIEALFERVRHLAAFWHLLQAVARPVAGALFAHLVVADSGAAPLFQIVAPVTGAAVAMLVHLAKCGWTTLFWFAQDRYARPGFVAVLEDVVVAGLVTLAVDAPQAGGLLTVVVLVSLFVVGRGIMRAGMFSHLLAWRRSWGSLTPFRWLTESELPADLARKVAEIERPLGRTFKVARVGGFKLSGAGLFRSGWLVVGASDPWWVTRTVRGARLTSLDVTGLRSERLEPLFLQVGGAKGPGEPSLILPRSGPSKEALNAELSRGFGYTEPVPQTGVDGPAPD